MVQALGILDLLALNPSFHPTGRSKIVRHQDSRYNLQQVVRDGWLDTYQSYQSRPVFRGADYLVVCLGDAGTTARFYGVYGVLQERPSREVPLPARCPYAHMNEGPFWYDLRRVDGFEALGNRVVIEWGKATRSWCQKLTNKEVFEIQRAGQVRAPFDDYLEFTLTHEELLAICRAPDAHREWRARLSAVAGIYLIVDSRTGDQYVGSASGGLGIWGRWTQYAKDGHGGNVRLKKLVKTEDACPDAFVYSVLQVLPKSVTRSDVLEREQAFKTKLGKRATALNAN